MTFDSNYQSLSSYFNMATNCASRSSSELLCKYFQNGVCRKGEHCCFSHDRSNKSDNVCKYYLQGSCSYGETCKYDHSKPDKNIPRSGNNSKPKSVIPMNELCKYLEKDCPSKFVSLKKVSTKSFPVDQQASKHDWVDAPEFVPGQKYQVRTESDTCGCETATKAVVKDNFSYSEATKSGVENVFDEMTEEEASLILCPFAAMGSCKLEDKCPYLHGLKCDICNNCCLDPNDSVQQQEHKEECMKWFEENMDYSFAVQKSEEVSCGICLDRIRLKSDSKDKRFGILLNCNHPFCLTCIRKWRSSSQTKNKIVRACPICRISSPFVIPSEVWLEESVEKDQLIKGYKDAMSTKPCKYFDCGKGNCPFGISCFYKHANADGTVEKVNVRRYDDSEGESKIINPVSLWQFIDARDNFDLDVLNELQ